MMQTRFKLGWTRLVVLCFAAIGLLHFSIAGLFWGMGVLIPVFKFGVKGSRTDWAYVFAHATPCFVFLVLFAIAVILALRHRLVSTVILAVALASSAFSFLYDARHHYYQIQAFGGSEGCSHTYITWWWYDDRHDPTR